MDITVAALFTAAGAGGAALLIRQIVELVKAAIPPISARFSGALQAFVLSAALYAFGFVANGIMTPDQVLVSIVSWLTCATAAVGIDSAWSHARNGAE